MLQPINKYLNVDFYKNTVSIKKYKQKKSNRIKPQLFLQMNSRLNYNSIFFRKLYFRSLLSYINLTYSNLTVLNEDNFFFYQKCTISYNISKHSGFFFKKRTVR